MKKRAGIQTSIANIVKAIEGGRAANALLTRLTQLENDEREVTTELQKAEREIAAANVERPTAKQVQDSWGAVLDVWPDLTEEEKVELLGTLVEEVEVKTKDRVVLRLAPFAEVGGLKLAINSHLGALIGSVANFPDIYIAAFEVSRPQYYYRTKHH